MPTHPFYVRRKCHGIHISHNKMLFPTRIKFQMNFPFRADRSFSLYSFIFCVSVCAFFLYIFALVASLTVAIIFGTMQKLYFECVHGKSKIVCMLLLLLLPLSPLCSACVTSAHVSFDLAWRKFDSARVCVSVSMCACICTVRSFVRLSDCWSSISVCVCVRSMQWYSLSAFSLSFSSRCFPCPCNVLFPIKTVQLSFSRTSHIDCDFLILLLVSTDFPLFLSLSFSFVSAHIWSHNVCFSSLPFSFFPSLTLT